MKGRGYAKFKLFNEIVAAGSSYVCRIRDNTAPQIVENKPLTDAERHLLSHNQNGIEIQTYCAIIACLVIALWTGRKLTKQTHEMICFRMMGWVTTEEVEAHLAKWKLADDESAKKRGFDT